MTKNIFKESSVQIEDAGILSSNQWPGPVSAHVSQQGEGYKNSIQRALVDLSSYYVAVNEKARTRCIDGRHDPDLDESMLGPQVAGGAVGAALSYRLGVDKEDLRSGTFLTDAKAMIGSYIGHNLAIGGHRDEASTGKFTVGCGAIDAMDTVLARMTDPLLVEDQKRILKTLLGPNFDRDIFLRNMGAAVIVNGRANTYFRNREKIIDIIEATQKGSVSTLQGEHKESLVIVNFVPHTTFSSNRFTNDFGGIQAFGYDIWRSMQVANILLPGEDQEEDCERFLIAQVMTNIATLMALTDGSQRLILRTI